MEQEKNNQSRSDQSGEATADQRANDRGVTAHTPGPWMARRTRGVFGVDAERWAINGPPQGLAGRWWVCSMVSDDQRDEANAHLIAAAPDLKAALITVVDAIFAADLKHGLEDEIEIARLAVAKAEGRQP